MHAVDEARLDRSACRLWRHKNCTLASKNLANSDVVAGVSPQVPVGCHGVRGALLIASLSLPRCPYPYKLHAALVLQPLSRASRERQNDLSLQPNLEIAFK